MGHGSQRLVQTLLLPVVNKEKSLQSTHEHDLRVENCQKKTTFGLKNHVSNSVMMEVWIWHESMNPQMQESNPSSIWGQCYGLAMFSSHDLGPIICMEQCLISTTFRSTISDQVQTIMLITYPNGDGCFHQAILFVFGRSGFRNMKNTLLMWPPQSPDLNPNNIWEAKLKKPSESWINIHQISHNWIVLFDKHGVCSLHRLSTSCGVNAKKNHCSIVKAKCRVLMRCSL